MKKKLRFVEVASSLVSSVGNQKFYFEIILILLQAILERTGYSLDVTTGQRKYGGPPPDWKGPAPGNGCEVSFNSGQTNDQSHSCFTLIHSSWSFLVCYFGRVCVGCSFVLIGTELVPGVLWEDSQGYV